MQKQWDSYVAHEDWQEGCSGLPNNIRWDSSHICNSYAEAHQWIESHDRGWYDQLAVRYRDKKLTPSQQKSCAVLQERANKLSARARELDNAVHYAGVKSAFVSCRSCSSKIATAYIGKSVKNHCPICGSDLRPESALERIQQAKVNAQHANDAVEKEKAALLSKNQTASLRWLVKIEYHS